MSRSYDQVVSILEEFSELKRKEITQNRATYYFPNSPIRRQTVLQDYILLEMDNYM